jgi:PKD repeat protein
MTYEIGEVLPVSVEAEDPDGKVVGVQYYINNVAITSLDSFPWTYSWNTMGEDEASYTIKAIAYDNDDDSKSDEITIFLENSAPVAFFTVDSTHGHTQSVFRFDATKTYDASDDSSTLMIRWDWTNDGTWDTNYSTERIVTHQYENPGTYTIRMEVKDSYDLISQMSLIIHVEPYNSAPTAKFYFTPEAPEMETEVTFDASESFDLEDDAQSLEVRWDFENDGTWDTGYLNTKIKKYTYSEEGSYIVKLEVRDSGGLTDVLNKEITVLYKNQSPTAVIECTPPYGDTQTLFTFSAAKCQDFEDDTSELEVRWDWESDGEWDTGFDTQKTITHRYSKQGTFTVTVEVRDTEELSSTATKDVFVSDYNSAPTAKFTISPETGDTETLFTFDASPSFDPQEQTSALQVRWDWESDGEWDTGYSQTKTITHQFPEAGSYRIKMEVIDNGELTDTISHVLTVNYKNETPTALFVHTPEHGTTETLFHFDASSSHDVEDASSELQVRWDWENDGNWDTGYSTTKTVTHSFDESSTYTVRLEVKDTDGGIGTAEKDIFVADYNSAPSARFTFTPESGNTETVFTFDASTSFDLEETSTNLRVRWDWENDGTWDTGYSTTKTATHQFNESGSYSVKLEVQDSGGLTSTVVKGVAVSHKNTAPVAILKGTPNYGTTETVFTFDVSESSDLEDDLANLIVRWDWENDGNWDTGFDTSKTITYSFTKEGNYTVKVEVRDTEELSGFDTKEIFISQLNTAPSARFDVHPSSGDTETQFTFDASESYDNEEQDEYLQVRWDWENDGIWDTGYSTQKIATHRYDSAGTYKILMEIRDSGELTDTVSHQLTVIYKNTPPTAVFQAIPSFGNTETLFTFDASASSDIEDSPQDLYIRWDFENDGIWNTDFDTSKTIVHQFPVGGTFSVKLEVIDTEGLTDSHVKEIIVANINSEPTAIAEVIPLVGNTRTDFSFDASKSYDKEDASEFLQVRWDFDDDNEWDTEYTTNKISQFRFAVADTYQTRLRVRDRGGLTKDTLIHVIVEEYVNTAPVAVFSIDPTAGPPETLFHFDATSSYDHEDDINNIQVRWDWENDGTWDTGYSYKKTASHLYGSDGTYIIKLEVRDSEGLSSTKEGTVVVSSTNQTPVAVINSDATSGDTETVFTFDASGSSDAEDALADLEVRWDYDSDGEWDTGYSTSKTVTHTFTTAGNYTVTLEVRDTEGATDQAMMDIYVDIANTSPTAVFTSNYSTGTTETVFTFDASGSSDAEDAVSSLEVRWDWEGDGTFDTPYHSINETMDHRFTSAGTYQVTARVKDSGGLTDDATISYTITEYTNNPPSAGFTVTPESGYTSTVFEFDASETWDYEDGNDLLYLWDWDDDSNWDTDTLSTSYVTHRYDSAGSYKVKLLVIDSGGLMDSTYHWYLEVSSTTYPTPTAIFTVTPTILNVGDILTVDASESFDAEDKYVLEYRWDWEDDGTWDTPYDTTKTETHSYDSTGEKIIRLEVRNSRNEVATDTETVTVQ